MDLRIMPAMEILGMKFLRGFEIPRNLQIFSALCYTLCPIISFRIRVHTKYSMYAGFLTHISLFRCLCLHTLVLLITAVVVMM